MPTQHPTPQSYGTPPAHGWPAQSSLPTYTNPVANHACRICGGYPTVDTSVRAHQGVLIVMRFQKFDGPFCRQCGIALVRLTTTQTLWQGWWSPFSLVLFTPFTLLWNLIAHRRFSRLAPAAPMQGRTSPDEGQPVHRQPLAYVALIPIIWAVCFITAMVTRSA
ncbi:hypothetical protein [Streptomyces sp. CB03234]|uniref:hypothetical protein n=2 Tax=unclassified Streptomyces TaxID=2593676 RepID=UPI000A98EA73|nr:hypothetical protein [Streptomyces sp. CB03234]